MVFVVVVVVLSVACVVVVVVVVVVAVLAWPWMSSAPRRSFRSHHHSSPEHLFLPFLFSPSPSSSPLVSLFPFVLTFSRVPVS